jgi:hypothetical protein
MDCPFREPEFQAEYLSDFGELIERRVRPATFEVGQAAEGYAGKFRQVSLPEAEQFPSRAKSFAHLLVSHGYC